VSPGTSSISIFGLHFVPGNRVTCKLNQVITEGFVASDSLVTCALPTMNSDLVFVEVSFDGQIFLSSVNSSFVIEWGTIVHVIQPTICFTNRECIIDIFGENFSENVYCEFNGQPLLKVQTIFHNSSFLSCKFQAGADGYLIFRVCNSQSQCHVSRIHVFDESTSFRVDKPFIVAREPVTIGVHLSKKTSSR